MPFNHDIIVHDVPIKMGKYTDATTAIEYFIILFNEDTANEVAMTEFMVKMPYSEKSELQVNPEGIISPPDSTAALDWIYLPDWYRPPRNETKSYDGVIQHFDTAFAIDTTCELLFGFTNDERDTIKNEMDVEDTATASFIWRIYLDNFHFITSPTFMPCNMFLHTISLSYVDGSSIFPWFATFYIFVENMVEDVRKYDGLLRRLR